MSVLLIVLLLAMLTIGGFVLYQDRQCANWWIGQIARILPAQVTISAPLLGAAAKSGGR